MNTSLLDVLHDGADDGGVSVGDAVDIDFGGVLEEAVDEDGTIGSDVDCVTDIVAEFVVLVDDHHTTSAEDEGWADQDGVTDAVGDEDGFVF